MAERNFEELIYRLDERTQAIQKDIMELRSEIIDIKHQIKDNSSDNRTTLKNYVTKEQFAPIQRAIYAAASLIVMTVLGTLLSLVVHKGAPF